MEYDKCDGRHPDNQSALQRIIAEAISRPPVYLPIGALKFGTVLPSDIQ